jgi:phosphate transport system substrate-binding protein
MYRITASILAASALAFTATAAHPQADRDLAALTGNVQIDGSSTVEPISSAVAEKFGELAPRVRVTVATSGTGGGFKRFVKGELDISDASRPIKKDETDAASAAGVEFIELPVAYDGLSVVVNPKNTFVNDLTIDEIKKIFLEGSAAKTWKDVRPNWPANPIKIYSPGTDSGTFDYFKEVVAGKDGAIRGDMSVSEDDNVLVRGVAGDENAIGFFGFAYYWANKDKLKVVTIDGGNGAIEPNHTTIENGTYAPFSRPLFIYVNAKSAQRPEVKALVSYYLEHAGETSEEVGYVKLPANLYAIVKKNFESSKTGTQFLGPDGKGKHGALASIYR